VTTTGDHERLREDLAGYVLGGLTPAEQHAVEAHLAECESCRTELGELDPVPVLLDLAAAAPATLSPAEAVVVAVPPDAPIGLVPAEAQAEPALPAARRHRASRTRTLVASAGVALAMVAAFTVGVVVAAPTEPAYGAPIALQPVGGSHAGGSAAVRPADHGTEVRLVLHDLPAATGTWYECIWWSATGKRWSAGTFRPGQSPDTQVELLAAAALHPGWRLAILEHDSGQTAPVTVLKTTT
jgi:anti-sigma factor RsiW